MLGTLLIQLESQTDSTYCTDAQLQNPIPWIRYPPEVPQVPLQSVIETHRPSSLLIYPAWHGAVASGIQSSTLSTVLPIGT